jgi:hypothetical protein
LDTARCAVCQRQHSQAALSGLGKRCIVTRHRAPTSLSFVISASSFVEVCKRMTGPWPNGGSWISDERSKSGLQSGQDHGRGIGRALPGHRGASRRELAPRKTGDHRARQAPQFRHLQLHSPGFRVQPRSEFPARVSTHSALRS